MPSLTVVADGRAVGVSVPDNILATARELYAKMDSDMDSGWQMGPEFIEQPDRVQRCQIVANKLLISLSGANETMATLMAGYILARLPDVVAVHIDTAGEMLNTEFQYASRAAAPASPRVTAQAGLSKREALAEAGKQVSTVYKAGRGWRYSTLDRASGQWMESPLLDDEGQAHEARARTFQERYSELLGGALN
jgi:hypothetical protein